MTTAKTEPPGDGHLVPVIGIAGGIGSGKSEVARVFESLGCVIADSDVEARRALNKPEVLDTLVGWWGPGVRREDGTADRAAIAAIVFNNPEERRRLETLVHPLVHEARREVIAKARTGGAVAVIVDAPLLFEVGIDTECDAVVFVDAPFEVRLDRVRRGRGWDEAELRRRESAQCPPEEKRRRSDVVIENAGSAESLRGRVEAALRSILKKRP